MNSRHLVDPELAVILEVAPDMGVSVEKLPGARAAIAEMTKLELAQPDISVKVTEHTAAGRGDSPNVRVLLYRPAGLPKNAPVVLQIHGGGFLFGTAELGDARNRAWAKAIGCVIASVDYRLAPETRYPGALEDCYAALEWIRDSAKQLDLDAERIAIRGESAGGGLAAALSLLSRDRGGPKILYQLLIYPMLDDRTGSDSEPHPFAGEFIWTAASNAFAWESWLGMKPASSAVPPLAAPARVRDLHGLPPTFIATAALDIFIDENLEFARRLMRAGVPTEVYVAPGAFHGFEAMVPMAAISQQFTTHAQAALRRAFKR